MWHNNDADVTSFMIAPEVGYELNKNWSIGATLYFKHSKKEVKDDLNVTWNGFAFAPYARYTFLNSKVVSLFVDGGLGVSSQKYKGQDSEAGFEIGVKPGIAIKLGNHLSFVTKYGFLGYRDDYMFGETGYGFGASSEDLSIGFHYIF